jgi:hypothetical protein
MFLHLNCFPYPEIFRFEGNAEETDYVRKLPDPVPTPMNSRAFLLLPFKQDAS